MDGTDIGVLIGCIITLIAGGILSFIGFFFFSKYLTQQKKCTATAVGTVVAYTLTVYSKIFRYPIVEFTAEDGKKYKVKGPEYRVHSVAGTISFSGKSGYRIEENDEKQKIFVRIGARSEDFPYPFGRNPLTSKYPEGTTFTVFYDPAHPKRGYVKRYCDKRFFFWIFQGAAIFCVLLCMFIALLPVLFY